MRFESAVTSVSWIPSAAITGVTKAPFEIGVTHYDDPPPDSLDHLERVVGPDGARFANELRAWIEVEDGRIVNHGQSGHGWISNSKVQLGRLVVLVPASAFPDLIHDPEVGTDYVRFRQTAGGASGAALSPSRR